jgi:hypothetical protein
MADNTWRGDAPAVAQVNTFAFAGTWETDDVVRVVIGGKTKDFTTGSATIATFLATLVTAWEALDSDEYPEFDEITPTRSGDNLLLTASTAGVPFTATLTPLEANLGAADAQTIEGAGSATTGTATTASSGPNHWDTAANWTLNAIPVNTNDVHIPSYAIILYGLAQSGVTLASLNIARGATIGLPPLVNEGLDNEYVEYRDLDLAIGATVQNVGHGSEQTGSQRINLNNGSVQTTLNIFSTGTAENVGDRTHAVMWRGTHASNAINLHQGELAIASRPGEVATVLTLRQTYVDNLESDTQLKIGSGVTLTGSGIINKNGGATEINCAVTTIVMEGGGTLKTYGSGAISSITVRAGTATLNSTGTITTLIWSGEAIIDCSKSLVPRTITNAERYGTATLRDPFKVITFTNGLDSHESDIGNLDLGKDIRITRGAIA